MSGRRVAVLAVRVLALFLAFESLRNLLRGFEYIIGIGDRELRQVLLSGQVSSVLIILIAAWVWTRADSLAARILDAPRQTNEQIDLAAAEDEISANLSGLDAHAIAFSVLGLFLVVQAAFQASLAVGQWIESLQQRATETGGDLVAFPLVEYRTTALSAGVYLVVGLLLTIGARTLAAFIRRKWWAGRGVVRARRIEIVDFDDTIRAQLGTEERGDGGEDVALTLFDEEPHARARLMVGDGGDPRLVFTDETGRATTQLPSN